jgi:hypothetical protein
MQPRGCLSDQTATEHSKAWQVGSRCRSAGVDRVAAQRWAVGSGDRVRRTRCTPLDSPSRIHFGRAVRRPGCLRVAQRRAIGRGDETSYTRTLVGLAPAHRGRLLLRRRESPRHLGRAPGVQLCSRFLRAVVSRPRRRRGETTQGEGRRRLRVGPGARSSGTTSHSCGADAEVAPRTPIRARVSKANTLRPSRVR